MSQFYGSIVGSASTAATRRGTKSSGISGHIRGWNVGAVVECSHEDGKDVVRVYETHGSSNPSRSLIAVIIEGIGVAQVRSTNGQLQG